MAKEVPQLGFDGNEPNYKDHWKGMPSYEQGNAALPDSTLHVHFATKEDRAAFMKLIGQIINPETRYIWHPKSDKAVLKDKRYVDVPEAEDDSPENDGREYVDTEDGDLEI